VKLILSKEVLDSFRPIIGVIYAKGVDNTRRVPEITELLEGAAGAVRESFKQYESPAKHPILAAWRGAYKKFGADPHEYRSSAEALVRRVLKGDTLPRINTLVDLYNYISLKYILPVGGENTDAISGDMHLAFASGLEAFTRINGTENETPKPGEVVYKDSAGVICRRWNWREADRTKMTESTVNAVMVIDAIPPTEKAAVLEATNELQALVKQYCGGESSREIMVG
jgi:DNA/RNA-binding domain of Phe-tRNA-synthetase-like protein